MKLLRPKPCNDSKCRTKHLPGERVALAIDLCNARGVKLTLIRRQVLELLWEIGHPCSAYKLIDALKPKVSRLVGPPTVYRALDFLIKQGLVAKIESKSVFFPCIHPERETDFLIFICSNCGSMEELENPNVENLLAEQATALGFNAAKRTIEVEGECRLCISK